MSMRQRVGRQDIEQFLIQLGRTGQPGRLYVTGGAALVHKGIRPGETLDIDIQITVDPANLSTQVARLKQQLNMNIEFASPGDFMPLPAQWEARSAFIRRYGQIDAFYFDWYSIALSNRPEVDKGVIAILLASGAFSGEPAYARPHRQQPRSAGPGQASPEYG